MRVSPVLRVTSSFLQKRTAMSFCFYQPMLDPRKHIYMNHVPHNVYADYWAIGEYPELHLTGSVAAATYQPRAQAILLETLKSRYVPKQSYRMLTWPRQKSLTNVGISFSAIPSKLRILISNLWRLCCVDWPQVFSSRKASGPGSKNNKLD